MEIILITRESKKIPEYDYDKFNTKRYEYKIYGDVDIFQIQRVVQELMDKMTVNLPDNVKLQISLENTANNRINETMLVNKYDIVLKISDWVSLFIDYYDMDIEDITFKLLAVEIPSGAGRVNRIITVDCKRSIINVQNSDTICLARAIVVSLSANNIEKLQNIFKNNLTESKLRQINKTQQNKLQLNDGIISHNELDYAKKAENYKKNSSYSFA